MKLQLIYDYSMHESDEKCMDEEDDCGYASDIYINSKLPHERMHYNDLLYRTYSKYFRHLTRYEQKNLIDVPDEIMMQYMLEGVYDLDFVAYNLCEHMICISNTEHSAVRYGDEYRYGRVVGSNWASSNEGLDRMFNFKLSNTSQYDEQRASRKDYMIVPDGDHYANMRESIEPYVRFKTTEWFKMASDAIQTTQEFRTNNDVHPDANAVWYDEDSNLDTVFRTRRIFEEGETEHRGTFNMSYEVFAMCILWWKNDHKWFIEAKPYLSEVELNSFRLMDERIRRKLAGTNW